MAYLSVDRPIRLDGDLLLYDDKTIECVNLRLQKSKVFHNTHYEDVQIGTRLSGNANFKDHHERSRMD